MVRVGTEEGKMQPIIATMDGKLFAYGDTAEACAMAFRSQIISAPANWLVSMLRRINYVAVSDDHASEVQEMLATPW